MSDDIESEATASLRKLNLGDTGTAASSADGKHKKRRKFFQSLDIRNFQLGGARGSGGGGGGYPAESVPSGDGNESENINAKSEHRVWSSTSRSNSERALTLSSHIPHLHDQHEQGGSCESRSRSRAQSQSQSQSQSSRSSETPVATYIEPITAATTLLDLEDSPQDTIKYLKIRVHELESIVVQKDRIIKLLKREIQFPNGASRYGREHRRQYDRKHNADGDNDNDCSVSDVSSGSDIIHSSSFSGSNIHSDSNDDDDDDDVDDDGNDNDNDNDNLSDLSNHAHISKYSDPHLNTLTAQLQLDLDLDLDLNLNLGLGGLGPDFSVDSISQQLSMTDESRSSMSSGLGGDPNFQSSFQSSFQSNLNFNSSDPSVLNVGKGVTTIGSTMLSAGNTGNTGSVMSSTNSAEPNRIPPTRTSTTQSQPQPAASRPRPPTTTHTSARRSAIRHSILPSEDDDDARFDHVIDQQYYTHDNESFEILSPYSVDMGRFKSRADPNMRS